MPPVQNLSDAFLIYLNPDFSPTFTRVGLFTHVRFYSTPKAHRAQGNIVRAFAFEGITSGQENKELNSMAYSSINEIQNIHNWDSIPSPNKIQNILSILLEP